MSIDDDHKSEAVRKHIHHQSNCPHKFRAGHSNLHHLAKSLYSIPSQISFHYTTARSALSIHSLPPPHTYPSLQYPLQHSSLQILDQVSDTALTDQSAYFSYLLYFLLFLLFLRSSLSSKLLASISYYQRLRKCIRRT